VKARLAMLAATATLVACGRSDLPLLAPGSQLPSGEWAADRVQLVTSDSVTTVVYYCVGGTFAGHIVPDATGHFAVNGRFAPYFGPFSRDMPAQMSGQVDGKTLTFAVAVVDTIRQQAISIGPATVQFGQHANIVVCP
jgi:glycerol uptake facilitator-like aquaporin